MLVTSCGIKVKRYVHKDGGLVEIEELTPEERARAATEIALTYLNALYRGKAHFEVADTSSTSIGTQPSGADAARKGGDAECNELSRAAGKRNHEAHDDAGGRSK